MYIYIPFSKQISSPIPTLSAGVRDKATKERQTNMIFRVKLHNLGGDNNYSEKGTRLENDLWRPGDAEENPTLGFWLRLGKKEPRWRRLWRRGAGEDRCFLQK